MKTATYTIEWPADTKMGMPAGQWRESPKGFIADYTAQQLRDALMVDDARRLAEAQAALDAFDALPAKHGDKRGRRPEQFLADGMAAAKANPQNVAVSKVVKAFSAELDAAYERLCRALDATAEAGL